MLNIKLQNKNYHMTVRFHKQNKIALYALIMTLCFSFNNISYCQSISTTQGKDFWVMFLNNNDTATSLSLIAAGNKNTIITVENPNLNWSTTVNLSSDGHVIIPISLKMCNSKLVNKIGNCGLHVTSTENISLYASNFKSYTYDITTILPTIKLKSYYISQDYPSLLPGAELGVLAIMDSTFIKIGDFDSVLLMGGQTYQIQSVSSTGTYSGTAVISNNKPFAMFQGHKCAVIPDGYQACDHLYEQSIPVDYWGREFVVTPVPNSVRKGKGDVVRITSSQDNCIVKRNGKRKTTLKKGETYEYIIHYGEAEFIETTEPATTCLYFSGCEHGGDPGDPASVIVPPVEQGVPYVTFDAYNTSVTKYHYVNIVTNTDNVKGMTIDGKDISQEFKKVNSAHSYATISVTPGTHTIENCNGNFIAFFYGLGLYESYAYTAGMGLKDLSSGQPENIEFEVNGQVFEMVCLGSGSFIMGATPEQGIDLRLNERPTHEVKLSSFCIGKYEVTQSLYKAVMGKNPSLFQGDNLPVENVSWIDCLNFITKLNDMLRDQLGNRKFALPSEAQWEFAARGGADGEVTKYSGSDDANDVAWISSNSEGRTHTVGMLAPNELGICDMSGNVNEWCYDWWSMYDSEHRRNPNVTSEGVEHRRLVRGGGWDRGESYCRVSVRHNLQPERKSPSIGFRIVLIDDNDPIYWRNE